MFVTVVAFAWVTTLWLRSRAYHEQAVTNLATVHLQREQALEELRHSHWTISNLVQLSQEAPQDSTRSPEERDALFHDSLEQYRTFLFLPGFGEDPALQSERSHAAILIASATERSSSPEQIEYAWNEAITLTRPLARARPDRYEARLRLSSAYFSLGQVYRKTDRPDEALRAYGQAVDELESHRRHSGWSTLRPDEQRLGEDFLATYHFHIADTLRHLARDAEALDSYQRAADHWMVILEQEPTHRAAPEGLATSKRLMSSMSRRLVRLPEALAFIRQAIRSWEEIVEQHPRSQFEEARILADCDHDLGAVHYEMGRMEESLAAHQRIVEKLSMIPEESPLYRDALVSLATAHHNIGRADLGLGRPRRAVEAYRRSPAVRELLIAAEPANAMHQDGCGGTWFRLGEALEHLGLREQAEAAYEHALTWNPEANR